MRPHKLFWDGSFRNFTQFFEEGSLFKVDVEAVGEAVLFLTQECELIDTEGELNFVISALVPA